MKLIGIDYGTSKVGLALGDSESRVATPFKVIKPNELALEIERLIEREGIGVAVFGLPLSMSGEETESTKKIRSVVEKLKTEVSVIIEFEDERLSTVQARHNLKNLGVLSQKNWQDDAVAAMYILQSFLDRVYG